MNSLLKILPACIIFASCGICKHLHCHPETSVRDSVAIHWVDSVRYTEKVIIRDSVVLVPLPQESSQSILPTMLPSHLETSLAESDAYVDSLGLHHTLNNKPGDLEAHVPVTEHQTTTEHSHQSDTSVSHSETQTVEVDKPLSWWQTLKIGAFWWLLAALLLTNIKPIIKLIKKLAL